MNFSEIQPSKSFLPLTQQKNQNEDITKSQDNSFVDSLHEMIGDVNSLQKDAGDLNERLIKGEPVDLHTVMIATEKAKTSFQLLLEMRNKFVDMYHEITRMQI